MILYVDTITVLVPAGSISASFSIGAENNRVVDGDTFVLLKAQAQGDPYNTVYAPYFELIDDEAAPVSKVRLLSAVRQQDDVGLLRLRFSGRLLNSDLRRFRVRIGARLLVPFSSNIVSASDAETVVYLYAGAVLPSNQPITLTVSGLRDSTLAVIPNASITLPPAPSNPNA